MNEQSEHPIEVLMKTSMENIKKMIEVNTVVGDAVETANGTVVMPVTKLTFSFVAGGTDIINRNEQVESDSENNKSKVFPFGGGSGAGVSIQPIAFMVIDKEDVRMMTIQKQTMAEKLVDKLIDTFNK